MIAVAMSAVVLGALCLAFLASPWPFAAPFVVFGLFGLAVLYRRPAWGLLGLVLLVPFEGFFKELGLSGAKLLGVAMLLILPLLLLQRRIPESYLRSNLWKPLLLLLFCMLLSLLYSENQLVSLGNMRELAVGMVLFPITLLAGRRLNLTLLAKVIVLGVAATSILAMASLEYQTKGRAIGFIGDPNYFALLIAIAVPPATLLVLRAPYLLARLFWLGITLLLLIGMTKTDSRSGLLVILLSVVVGGWHHRVELQRLRPKHLGFVMLGAAIVIPLTVISLPADYVERIKSLSFLKSGVNAYQDPSLGRRASYLIVGTKMIGDNPLLGAGPGTFPLHYAQTGYAKAFSESPQNLDLYRRAHNTYLEVFSEMGVPAGLLFTSLLLFGLYNFERARDGWLRRGDQGNADLATHLGLSLFAIALFLLFLSIPNHKYLWIFLALSSVVRQQAETGAVRE